MEYFIPSHINIFFSILKTPFISKILIFCIVYLFTYLFTYCSGIFWDNCYHNILYLRRRKSQCKRSLVHNKQS
jgi:hypothetical protein